ncbi:MAG: DUF4369 domain-containing protein [Prevotella sp.]|jgi:hypothetical protein|nr:DUF4369 domain-containing protein [Prevotella sp.]
MRKILLAGIMALTAVTIISCRQNKQQTATGPCHIHGTISEQYNDKRIFLVPLTGPKTSAYVDSVEVKDGTFEFETDTVMMAQILMDYHYRLGLQPLLVVTEPGDVNVSIDSISHATGTPQNDSLEIWKSVTEEHNAKLALLRQQGRTREADSIHIVYKLYTRKMAKNLNEGLLKDFLSRLFPHTYKKVMPDGSTVTIDADTHEQVPE